MHHLLSPSQKLMEQQQMMVKMPMYNQIEYSSGFSETTGSLWFYSKDEATNSNADFANCIKFKSFEYKAELLNTEADVNNGILKTATIAVPLKYLSNFWRSLEMSLINCKFELKHKWTKYCVWSAAIADSDNAYSNNIVFTIKDRKLYVPVLTLSAKENRKL